MESVGSELVSLHVLEGCSPWNFLGKIFIFSVSEKKNILETAAAVITDLGKFRIFFTWPGKTIL